VRLPVVVSVSALLLNTLLNYTFVLGKFGFPAMGLRGAALAGLIARSLECTSLVIAVYLTRSPVAARLKELFSFDRPFAWKFLKSALPVTAQEMAWSSGNHHLQCNRRPHQH
jgi:Na+-driven multidrug efflux pump